MSIEALTYVVIAPNYFGKADSIEKAWKNCKKAGYHASSKKEYTVIAIDAPPDKCEVYGDVGVSIETPEGSTLMRLLVRL